MGSEIVATQEDLIKARDILCSVCNERDCPKCTFRVNIGTGGWICELSLKPCYWGKNEYSSNMARQ